MSKQVPILSVVVSAAAVAVFSNFASAMPVADPLAIRNAAGTDIEMVWGRGFGWGFGAGFLGGAIVGGALVAPYYRYGYGYPITVVTPITDPTMATDLHTTTTILGEGIGMIGSSVVAFDLAPERCRERS